YQGGSIRYTKVLPIAGNHFTKDLAVGLRATLQDAERIKREIGNVVEAFTDNGEEIEIKSVNGKAIHKVNKQQAQYILHARALELCKFLQREIARSSLSSMMISGLVITGGGSLLKGIDDLANSVLSLPVRTGGPQSDHELLDALHSPIYATGYGLLQYELTKACFDGHFPNACHT
ncbi:MAG: rod shape-determining protein, partial [Ghiorsea sp.]|nr:rod shape-determining protein [Ghiorsea sp.]